MGNFSRFIRPGWNRIGTSTNSSNNVHISAFKDSATNKFAIVAINENGNSQNRTFTLNGYDVSSVIPYTTSSGSDLSQGNAITLSNGSFSASLPANSVTTFYAGDTTVSNRGDVDGDGDVDIGDALFVAQYYVNLAPSPFDPVAADTDCDGNVDIVDALLIARYYVRLIDEFCP
jgi:glucuronoarabinoxylan endo-1,4-beta-xylanase